MKKCICSCLSVANKNDKTTPEEWKKDGNEGYDWFRGFIANNREFSLLNTRGN
jgi:hypothetical protein